MNLSIAILEIKHLIKKKKSLNEIDIFECFTSRWPLKAAWCSAVRPALSDTFTLLSKGTRASAQRTALLAAAMWRGVCQFLSLAFTSAECFSNTCTASCKTMHCESFLPYLERTKRCVDKTGKTSSHLTAGGHSPMQGSQPLVIFGINSCTFKLNKLSQFHLIWFIILKEQVIVSSSEKLSAGYH